MEKFNILIGKTVYLSEPQLVSNESEAYQVPVKINSLTPLENAAGFIVNGNYLMSYTWLLSLYNSAKELESK